MGMSNKRLVDILNHEVEIGKGMMFSLRVAYLTKLRAEIERRNIDYSAISDFHRSLLNTKVKLTEDRFIPDN